MGTVSTGEEANNRCRPQAAPCVSFYDGGSHESSPSSLRTEVRTPAGGGSLFPVAFPRRRHRPHAADRTPWRRCVLAGHRFPVRVPPAVPARLLGGDRRDVVRGGTARPHPVRAADSLLRIWASVRREVPFRIARRVAHAHRLPRADFLRPTPPRAVFRAGRTVVDAGLRLRRRITAWRRTTGVTGILAGRSELVDRRPARRSDRDTAGAHGGLPRIRLHAARARQHLVDAGRLPRIGAVAGRGIPARRRRAHLTLDVPYIIYPVLVWIAMLSGPRRTALAAGLTVAVASLATTRGSVLSTAPINFRPSSRCACCRCCCCRR